MERISLYQQIHLRMSRFSFRKCIDDEYSADSDLIEYVEGKWPVPEYRTFYEYLCSMDWMLGGKTDDL